MKIEMNKPGVEAMKLGVFFAIVACIALPAFGQTPTCPSPQVLQGNNCTLALSLGWATAGQGADSIITIYVPPNVNAPVTYHFTALSSSLGNSYTGYFGLMAKEVGKGSGAILTITDLQAGGDLDIGAMPPGSLLQIQVFNICWDPTCTSSAPAGAVPNMFSAQLVMVSPNGTDINTTGNPGLTVRFLSGTQVTFEEQEIAQRTDSLNAIIPGVSMGPTTASRYVYTSTGAVTAPFDVISISNLNNTNSISGTATIADVNGSPIVTANIPTISGGGAAGFLVIAIPGNNTAALFPANTTLPAGPDGLFHGMVIITITGGLTSTGYCVVLAQEFDGNTMLNLYVGHSPVP